MVVILLLGLVEPRKPIFITRSVHLGVSLENRIPIKLDMSVQFSDLYQVCDCSSLNNLIIASLYLVVKSFSMYDTRVFMFQKLIMRPNQIIAVLLGKVKAD